MKVEDVKTTEAFLNRQPILTNETVEAVQEKTVGQSGNSYWHQLRKGRITASNFYAVHTRVNSFKKNSDIDMSSSISTVMGVTTPNPNIRALKFGRENESVAKDIYCKQYASNHVNACFRECGLFLDPNNSYLAASPDMLVCCDCCGEGLLEVKCTLKPKCDSCHSFCTCNLPDYISHTGDALEIRQNHRYFCQVQGQMAITQRKWCDLFVYSCNGTFLRRITFQQQYYASVQDNLMFFFKTFIAPKLLERQDNTDYDNVSALSIPTPSVNEPMEVKGSGHVYFCTICNSQVLEQENIKSFGQRSICCDLCEQWFHFKCVGISKANLNNMTAWLCSRCLSL